MERAYILLGCPKIYARTIKIFFNNTYLEKVMELRSDFDKVPIKSYQRFAPLVHSISV